MNYVPSPKWKHPVHVPGHGLIARGMVVVHEGALKWLSENGYIFPSETIPETTATAAIQPSHPVAKDASSESTSETSIDKAGITESTSDKSKDDTECPSDATSTTGNRRRTRKTTADGTTEAEATNPVENHG